MAKKSSGAPDGGRTKILQALNNPKWRYRTATGIAKETHLEPKKVDEVLRKNPDVVRVSMVKTASGETLFALKKKVSAVGDVWTAVRAINKVRHG
ncbi:hypothetical protein [Rubrivivax benzoatilyticus]|uniref:Uncharacterized protein n=1 Tax=Rubrivivax benzoatilyticus TaxID=316997 RepID=A0ABX0HZD3_9BURK|nr:hypothetical protein [Rubrivivax benzoatilyticus]NHL00371.1 hypothetical protein [Rubrivivax benzoatilyticus]NHL26243.1 hypothetical protein [Rubrivivax benzoatilyticus]